MTAAIGIALVGAAGRMGKEIARAAAARDDVAISSAVERRGSPDLGRDLGEIAGLCATGVLIGDDLAQAARSAKVVVDLSVPQSTEAVVAAAVDAGVALVCGTTGLRAAQLTLFEAASKSIPVLYATNLSPGVAVLAELVAAAVRALGADYDVEIVEMHHRDKLDAPSGTALTLARAAAKAADFGDLDDVLVHGRRGAVGRRTKGVIGMHAVRGGGVFGDHTVILAGEHERLELTHRAGSRALFARGALLAAIHLATARPGLYTMADVLAARAS